MKRLGEHGKSIKPHEEPKPLEKTEPIDCIDPNLQIVNYLSGELSLTKKYEN